MSENAFDPSKERMKWRIPSRFIRRMIFGIVAAAILVWLVVQIEYTNQLRGIESSKATGLSSVAGPSFDARMLWKGGAAQMKIAQTPVVQQGPLISRSVSLSMSVRDFARARSLVDQIVKTHAGYTASMTISSPKDASHSLSANIAIPSAQCDAVVDELRALGRVEEERQGSEEVTAQAEDLDIRLKNSREAESRLGDILRMGTGRVSDVLEVEKEMARVREEIERMESEQKHLNNRVAFASIDLNLTEEYQAQLGGGSPLIGLRIRNAMVSGYHDAAEGLLSAFVFFLNVGPSLILWALALFWPARWAWRRWRKSQADGVANA